MMRTFARTGGLNAPYLCAFLKHHKMPLSREDLNGMSGPRLWERLLVSVPSTLRSGTTLQLEGILCLVKVMNHGFKAPHESQQMLLTFVRSLSASAALSVKLEDHYQTCWAFRSSPGQLSSPPTHLDFFKDERVSKSWGDRAGSSILLLHANDLLRTWPDLMQSTWNAANVSRDCLTVWEAAQEDIAQLHRSIDEEGAGLCQYLIHTVCFIFLLRFDTDFTQCHLTNLVSSDTVCLRTDFTQWHKSG
jgi:hypothetical protein